MKNDEQQPPQEPQPYQGWTYDQAQQSSAESPFGYPPPQTNNPNNPYVQQQQPLRVPTNPLHLSLYNQFSDSNAQFGDNSYNPDLTMDMGSSLGYSQSIQYHALSIPQPTQPSTKLYQTRLKQLSEERLRRQQRRTKAEAPPLVRPKGHGGIPEKPGVAGLKRTSIEISVDPFAVTPRPQQGESAVAVPNGNQLQPAIEKAQDTASIQKVNMARASSLISGAFMVSSILGLVQTFLFTYIFGRTSSGDAYLQAYLIPNLIFSVISGGALSSAFIPVFTSYAVKRNDEETAWHIASSALNLSVTIMIGISVIAFFLVPFLVPLYSRPDEISLIITLTRIMLIQAIVLGSGVIVSAVLNSKQDFTRTALGAILYNVGLNLGLLPGLFITVSNHASSPASAAVYAATWGVVLAAILQLGVQLPGLKKVNMRYTFVFDWRHPGVIQIARQMVPRILNAVMLSFSTVVDRVLLSLLSAGLLNAYTQAFSILLLPVSLFGSSVSTAAFPTLSGYVARGRFDRVRNIITETLRGILFLTIPSSIGLVVLSFPITQTLLEHGNFDLQATQFASITLLFFALGLPGLAAVEILTRSFYALQDSKTAVAISVTQFILKIALSVSFVDIAVLGVQWGMGALAFSTSIASTLEAIVLFFLLSNRIGGFELRAYRDFFIRALMASAAMAVALIIIHLGLDHIIDTTSMTQLTLIDIFHALFKLLIELGVGSAAFLVAARLLHIEEMNSGLVRRVLNLLRIPWL